MLRAQSSPEMRSAGALQNDTAALQLEIEDFMVNAGNIYQKQKARGKNGKELCLSPAIEIRRLCLQIVYPHALLNIIYFLPLRSPSLSPLSQGRR